MVLIKVKKSISKWARHQTLKQMGYGSRRRTRKEGVPNKVFGECRSRDKAWPPTTINHKRWKPTFKMKFLKEEPVSCVLAPLGWWTQICRLKNSTISSLRAGLGLMSAQTYSMEGRSSSPSRHSLILQFIAADLKKMFRAEMRCSKTAKCFSCLIRLIQRMHSV